MKMATRPALPHGPLTDANAAEEIMSSVALVLELVHYELDAGDAFDMANGPATVRALMAVSASACRDVLSKEFVRLCDMTQDMHDYPPPPAYLKGSEP